MKKLLLAVVFFIGGIACAQPVSQIKILQDTTIQIRSDLNTLDGEVAAIVDTTEDLRSNINTNTADIATNTANVALKAPLASPTFTGTVTIPTLNVSSAFQIGGVAITSSAAELNFSSGATSNIQAQLNLKETKANHDTLAADVQANTSNLAPLVAGTSSLYAHTALTLQTLTPKWRFISASSGFGWGDGAGGYMGIPYYATLNYSNFDSDNGLFFLNIDYTNQKLVVVDKVYDRVYNVSHFEDKTKRQFNFQYPQTDEAFFLFEADFGFTIDSLQCINISTDIDVDDSTSFQLWHGASYSAAVRTFTETDVTNYVTESPQSDLVSESFTIGFNDATVANGEELWFVFDDVQGTSYAFIVKIFYTRD